MSQEQYIRVPLSAIVIMKGLSQKDGEPYEFLNLDYNFRNHKANITALKNAGVKVIDNTPGVQVDAAQEGQAALTLSTPEAVPATA